MRLLGSTRLDLGSVRGKREKELSGMNVRTKKEEGGGRDEYDYPLHDYRNEKIS